MVGGRVIPAPATSPPSRSSPALPAGLVRRRLYVRSVPSSGRTRPTCYVASPCGFADATRLWYETVLLPLVEAYAVVLDPWSVDASQMASAKAVAPQEVSLALGEAHYAAIRNRADLLVAVLDQEPPDNGTVAEVAWAAAHSVPVIGYRSDFRVSGEPGMPYNLMIGAAIRLSGGVEVSSVGALELELKRLTTKFAESGEPKGCSTTASREPSTGV
jgi:nucleoside 2-deoxyribosyltransferase